MINTGSIDHRILASLLVLLFAAFVGLITIRRQVTKVSAPRVGKSLWLFGLSGARTDFLKHGKALTKLGYDRYKDSFYWIQTGDIERLVISNKYVEELRKYPDSVVDSRQAVVERNLGWSNGVDIILKTTSHVHVCRTRLVQNLRKITQTQIDDLPAILDTELATSRKAGSHKPPCSVMALGIVNRVVAKALVGPELCYSKEWLSTSLQAAVHVGMQSKALQSYPVFIRPWINPLLKPKQILDQSYATAETLVQKVASHRQAGDSNTDILQWLIDSNKGQEMRPQFLANQLLFVAIAAIRSTAASVTNTIYDIIDYSECQEVLRNEINHALQESGGWNLDAIDKMEKLDSFIKESQRLNHPLLLSFNRKIQSTVRLSDGLVLPRGTFICTPAYWVARDAHFFDGGEEFRPWRWYDLRKEAQREGRSTTAYFASSTSAENLHWGYGRNACPGRFMAASQIKLIVAWILWHYDLRFPEGQLRKPENVFVDERVQPDPDQIVDFQAR